VLFNPCFICKTLPDKQLPHNNHIKYTSDTSYIYIYNHPPNTFAEELFSTTLFWRSLDLSGLSGRAPTGPGGRAATAWPGGVGPSAVSKRWLHATAERLKHTANARGQARAWMDG